MAREIFVDTSGFYTMLVKDDEKHAVARQILHDARRRKRQFVTTDYVLDETATLVKARGMVHLLASLFARLDGSRALRVEWTDSDRFLKVRALFLKTLDQTWSFTDCVSFQVMRELRLRDSLTNDAHFVQAGFMALLR
jgi:predicted nucleic acid-binding protein